MMYCPINGKEDACPQCEWHMKGEGCAVLVIAERLLTVDRSVQEVRTGVTWARRQGVHT
jgi:hypothetical protein